MYLIGSQADSSLGWIAQRVDGLQSAPGAIQTGDSGLAASSRGTAPGWPLAGFGIAALAAGVVAASHLRRPAAATPVR